MPGPNPTELLLHPEQIETLLAISKHGNFTAAASELGIRQSAVSQLVKRLEVRLGRPLFRRRARGVEYTVDGRALVIYAKSVAALAQDLRSSLDAGDSDPPLRIGIGDDFSRTALPAVLCLLSAQHATLRLRIIAASSQDLVRGYDQERFDAVVMKKHAGLPRALFLWSEPMEWMGRRDICVDDRPVPLVVPPAPATMRDLICGALDAVGRHWIAAMETTSLSVAEAALTAGIGITAFPRGMQLPGFAQLAGMGGLPDLPPVDFVLGRRSEAIRPSLEAFIEVLATAARLSFEPPDL